MSPTPVPWPDHARPETYPAYAATAKISLSGGSGTAIVGLKSTGLDVYFQDGQVLHYDLEGRLQRVGQPNVQWRRGLSGRTLELRRRTRESGGGLQRCQLSDRQADQLVSACHDRLQGVWEAVCSGPAKERDSQTGEASSRALLQTSVALASRFDLPAARHDLAQFRAIYHDIPILPPDQYNSLVLLASDGCRYNKCTFCGFYRDTGYRARSPSEFGEHVEQAVAYHGHGLALRRGIFLGQANALLGPPDWREELLRQVNRRFDLPHPEAARCGPEWWRGSISRFTGITSFLDAFAGVRMKAAEFAALRRLNLRRIFIGMETGDAELLDWLRKPAQPPQILDTVRAARQAGVQAGVIVLLGAGGERFFDAHVRESVALIRAMQLGAGDFVYLSPLVAAPDTEYAELAQSAGIEPLSATRMAEQERRIRQGVLAGQSTPGPYLAHYEVEHFVY